VHVCADVPENEAETCNGNGQGQLVKAWCWDIVMANSIEEAKTKMRADLIAQHYHYEAVFHTNAYRVHAIILTIQD